jgi:PAS domain S-box-containing protein
MRLRISIIANFIRGNLRNKMILGISFILFVIMGSFTYYEMTKRVKADTGVQENRALEISDIVMRSIEYPMLDGEMEYVQRILEDLNEIEDLYRIKLCDLEGMVKYAGPAELVGRSIASKITKKALETKVLAKGFEYHGDEKILSHAMPIKNEEACYKCHGSEDNLLGVLSVGISWSPIEKRIVELRNHEVAVTLSAIGVVGFFLTLWLSRYISRPISELTHLADTVSHGKSAPAFGETFKCWQELQCEKKDCPAYGMADIPCWYVPDTLCSGEPSGKFPGKIEDCKACKVYDKYSGDEIDHLSASFKHMLYRLNQFETELRNSERKYRRLFNADPNPIFIVDSKRFTVLDVNNTAEKHYGYSREELLQKTFFDLTDRVYEDIATSFASIKDEQRLFFFKRQHRKKGGDTFFVNIHVCPAEYMDRKALIITTTDITEAVEKEAQLIQASKMSTLGTMASGIAHELNQPLNVIKVGSDFFLKMINKGKDIDLKTFHTMAKEISSHVDRASSIINHLREFARASDVSRTEVNINVPIKDVFKVLGQQLTLHEVYVDFDLADDLPPILADHNRLEQVFVNLVSNALDALDERGREEREKDWKKTLTIKTFIEDKRVVAMVSDNGTGMSEDILGKMFEPFFTTKEVGKGTGLGVSISYGIVKDYGGEIVVESEEGEGTSFIVSFPAVSKSDLK